MHIQIFLHKVYVGVSHPILMLMFVDIVFIQGDVIILLLSRGADRTIKNKGEYQFLHYLKSVGPLALIYNLHVAYLYLEEGLILRKLLTILFTTPMAFLN